MFSNPTAVTFIGYLIVMVGVGVFAYYYTRSYTDFILGGRSLGGFEAGTPVFVEPLLKYDPSFV